MIDGTHSYPAERCHGQQSKESDHCRVRFRIDKNNVAIFSRLFIYLFRISDNGVFKDRKYVILPRLRFRGTPTRHTRHRISALSLALVFAHYFQRIPHTPQILFSIFPSTPTSTSSALQLTVPLQQQNNLLRLSPKVDEASAVSLTFLVIMYFGTFA